MTESAVDGTDWGLASRLTFLIGEEPARNFARRIGIKESTLRSVLKGTRPSIDFVTTVARSTGASIEWLATGRGRPYPKGTMSARRDFNREVYDLIAQCVESVFRDMGVSVEPGVAAATVIDCYQDVMDIARDGEMEEYRTLLPWVEYGIVKQGHYHLERQSASGNADD